MNKRRWDQDKFRIQKRQFGEEEGEDEEGGMQRRFGDRRGGQRANHQKNNQHIEVKGKQKNDAFNPNFLRNFIKKPAVGTEEKTKKNFKWNDRQNGAENKQTNVHNYRGDGIYRPQNEELKKKLDEQIEEYQRKSSNNKQKKSQKGKNQPIQISSDSDGQLSFQVINQDTTHKQQDSLKLHELSYSGFSIVVPKPSYPAAINNTVQKQKIKAVPEKKVELKNNKTQTPVVQKQKIIKKQSTQQRQKPSIQKKANIKQIKKHDIEQIKPIKLEQIKLVQEFKVSTQDLQQQKEQSHLLLNKQNSQVQPDLPKNDSIDFFPDQLTHVISESNYPRAPQSSLDPKLQQNQPLEADVRQSIQTLAQGSPATIYLTFEPKQNILQFAVKEIDLVMIGVTVKLDSLGSPALKRFQEIGRDQLSKYISFLKTSHYFPKMGASYTRHLHYTQIADQQQQIRDSSNRIELQLCKIKIDPTLQKKMQKVDKSLVVVRLVAVRCMECEARNEIAVIQHDQSVGCSCRNCSAKIQGRIAEVRVEPL